METVTPSGPQAHCRSGKGVIGALAASTLALSACTTGSMGDEITNDPEPALSVEQSPIMNGHNFSKSQALLTMEVLAVAPTSQAGYAPDSLRIDQDRPASDAGWADPSLPNDHCTVSEATLARDGVAVGVDAKTCEISGGRWFDPLSGQTVGRDDIATKPFLPTERAWASGASQWRDRQFVIYRDSPEAVMAISDESYAERGQRGPAEWRPTDESLWCGYALRWVSEKNTYGLFFESQAEADALTEMLNTCPDEGFANPSV